MPRPFPALSLDCWLTAEEPDPHEGHQQCRMCGGCFDCQTCDCLYDDQEGLPLVESEEA